MKWIPRADLWDEAQSDDFYLIFKYQDWLC